MVTHAAKGRRRTAWLASLVALAALGASAAPSAPLEPSGLAQTVVGYSGNTYYYPIPTGGFAWDEGYGFYLGAASPAPSAAYAFEIELRSTADAFQGVPTHLAGLVTPLADGPYHWQVRAVDASTGEASAWVSYGGNSELDPDFNMGLVPPAFSGLVQHDEITPIPLGSTTGASAITFEATVYVSTLLPAPARLEVEVRPVGTAFTGTASASSPYVGSGVTGVVLSLPDGAYHWQARAVKSTGEASPWIPFGQNGEAPDFLVATAATPAAPAAGSDHRQDCGAGSAQTGSPLTAVLIATLLALGILRQER